MAGCREVIPKLAQVLGAFEVVKQCLKWNSPSTKDGSSAKHFGVSNDQPGFRSRSAYEDTIK
jgi:hypothetical protein